MGIVRGGMRRNITKLFAAAALTLIVSVPAFASLSQGFATTSPIVTGSLVSLDEKKSGTVVVADLNNVGRLFGVVVPDSSASISLSGTGSGQVQVVTTGTVQTLVTTTGGSIHVGDYVSVSPIAGVGQKVGASSTRVIGTAAADFDGTGDGVTKRTINDGSGNKEVAIGQIPIVVSVSSYTATDGKQSYVIPNWLQNLSNTLAGKAVSPVRIIVAGLILIVAVVSISVLLYAAVRNSIISIGRNPLSRTGVLQGLLTVGFVAVIILAITAVAMYLVISR
ncbi:MAG TPA: hypothetical protein VHQ86_04710 [Candidatus Saccharimonadia bacterium]|nr:hypothetical protein [Candidatus Saccharimonadia bacterium]